MANDESHNAELIKNKVHSVTIKYGELFQYVTARTQCGIDVTSHIEEFGASQDLTMARLNHYLCKKCYPNSA